MIETAFVIFLAGCSHDLSLCEPVATWEITAADIAACETLLEEKMLSAQANWPVFYASCVPVGADATVASPEWWMDDMFVAGLAQ